MIVEVDILCQNQTGSVVLTSAKLACHCLHYVNVRCSI